MIYAWLQAGGKAWRSKSLWLTVYGWNLLWGIFFFALGFTALPPLFARFSGWDFVYPLAKNSQIDLLFTFLALAWLIRFLLGPLLEAGMYGALSGRGSFWRSISLFAGPFYLFFLFQIVITVILLVAYFFLISQSLMSITGFSVWEILGPVKWQTAGLAVVLFFFNTAFSLGRAVLTLGGRQKPLATAFALALRRFPSLAALLFLLFALAWIIAGGGAYLTGLVNNDILSFVLGQIAVALSVMVALWRTAFLIEVARK